MVPLTFFILLAITITKCLTTICDKGNSNCTCIWQRNSYNVVCPELLTANMEVDYLPDNRFQIQCNNSSDHSFSLLKGLNFGPVKFFGLKFCPWPKIPFKELMESLQITQVTKIDFRSHSELGDSLLPTLFEGLETVTSVSLNNNGLTSLPENMFDDMPQLTSVSLWDNHLKSIPKYIFSHNPQLEVVELGSNDLVSLEPEVFKNLTELRFLNLWSNKLMNLTGSLFKDVQNLESLDLSSNGLKTLPPDIFMNLGKLSALNLNNNEFTNLPNGLFNSTPFLETLRFSYNRETIQTLPHRFLSNLTMLSDVNIAHSNILTLPEDLLWDSTNIKTVSFKSNQLTKLPKELFRDTKKLQTVDFSKNKLESLPDFLFALSTKLEVANFSDNHLHNISNQIFRGPSQLKNLDLRNNKLNNIDTEAFLGLESLTEINLSNNNLTFKDSNYDRFEQTTNSPLQYCQGLEKVLLAKNNIEFVFQDWIFLTSLQVLDLSQNNITEITVEDLLFLSKGVTVNLQRNKIRKIDLRHIEQHALAEMTNNMGVDYGDKQKTTNILIQNNPIRCDCFIYELIRYYEKTLVPEVHDLFNIDIGDTECVEPKELEPFKVKKLNSTLLVCSLDQIANISHPCPTDCLCRFRRHDKAITMDCHGKNFTEIPRNIPFADFVQKIELNMRKNKLRKLPTGDIFIKHNITKLDVSHNQITDVDKVLFSKSLQSLELNHNNMTRLSEKSLTLWKDLKHLSYLTLHENHWQCDCETLSFVNFIHNNYQKIANHEAITCWKDSSKHIKSLTADDLCPFGLELIIFGCITIAILGVLTGLSAAMYYRYQKEIKVWLFAHQLCLWFVTEEELDKDKQYDAFVSYSVLDKEFVEKLLVTELESGLKPFKLCLHYRDWKPGEWIHNQIIRSVDESRRTLIVLSRNFLDSDWSRLEFQAAHKQALSEGRARVIIILYGDIGPKDNLDADLKTYLSTNTYVEWGDPWFWKKLRYALPHPPDFRKNIPSKIRDKNIRRYEQEEKLDLVRKSNDSLNTQSTPPTNSVMTYPLKALNSTREFTLPHCDIMAQMA